MTLQETTLVLLCACYYSWMVAGILGALILHLMLASPWAHLELISSIYPHRAG